MKIHIYLKYSVIPDKKATYPQETRRLVNLQIAVTTHIENIEIKIIWPRK